MDESFTICTLIALGQAFAKPSDKFGQKWHLQMIDKNSKSCSTAIRKSWKKGCKSWKRFQKIVKNQNEMQSLLLFFQFFVILSLPQWIIASLFQCCVMTPTQFLWKLLCTWSLASSHAKRCKIATKSFANPRCPMIQTWMQRYFNGTWLDSGM